MIEKGRLPQNLATPAADHTSGKSIVRSQA
jgi:hypothetical protein